MSFLEWKVVLDNFSVVFIEIKKFGRLSFMNRIVCRVGFGMGLDKMFFYDGRV